MSCAVWYFSADIDNQLCIAFITYSTSDARPSPLLSKRFFAELQNVTKELRDEPGRLGIGQTTSGGARGMAALEGLVAAIEVHFASYISLSEY